MIVQQRQDLCREERGQAASTDRGVLQGQKLKLHVLCEKLLIIARFLGIPPFTFVRLGKSLRKAPANGILRPASALRSAFQLALLVG